LTTGAGIPPGSNRSDVFAAILECTNDAHPAQSAIPAKQWALIQTDAVVSRRRAREYDGLWMKEPQEFLFDPLPRARRFPQKFPAPPPSGQPPDDVLTPEVAENTSPRGTHACTSR
jgi:hypothetical protein